MRKSIHPAQTSLFDTGVVSIVPINTKYPSSISKDEQLLSGYMGELKVEYVKLQNFPDIEINESDTISKIIRTIWPSDITYRERFFCCFLNQANRLIGYNEIGAGGVAFCPVDVKLLFQKALLCPGMVSILICHNHPGGILKPSDSDISLTKKIKKSCELLEIRLLDHLIVTENSYFSFANEGLL
ncbi:MAG: JAB domain-containing protein [Cytophagales bacterium]|nr:JAB domain-containing protein [Cytophagales bacterium]MCA6382356.1 JAB domain-containing protein [Cytophagales bacterium]